VENAWRGSGIPAGFDLYGKTAPGGLRNLVCRQARIPPALTFALRSFESLLFSYKQLIYSLPIPAIPSLYRTAF
jgi:hypothetical protein